MQENIKNYMSEGEISMQYIFTAFIDCMVVNSKGQFLNVNDTIVILNDDILSYAEYLDMVVAQQQKAYHGIDAVQIETSLDNKVYDDNIQIFGLLILAQVTVLASSSLFFKWSKIDLNKLLLCMISLTIFTLVYSARFNKVSNITFTIMTERSKMIKQNLSVDS